MISNKSKIVLSAVSVAAAIVLFASAPLVATHQAYAQWWGGCGCGFPGWGWGMGGFGGPFMGGLGYHHHGFHVHVHGFHVHVHHVGGYGGGGGGGGY